MSAVMGKQGHTDDLFLEQKVLRNAILAGEYDRRCRNVAYTIPRERLATLCGVSYSYLGDVLNTNVESERQKPWQHKWDVVLAQEAPHAYTEEILDWLCELAGREKTVPKRLLTPEERLMLMLERIKQRGLDPLFTDLI
jgi:hypothetical protein